MSYIKQMKSEDCNNAVKRIFKNINIAKINSFIDEVENISNERKEFYKRIIKYRYDILQNVYKAM